MTKAKPFKTKYLTENEKACDLEFRTLCKRFGYIISHIRGSNRGAEFVAKRERVAMALYQSGRYSLTDIATVMCRHHTTILNLVSPARRANARKRYLEGRM
jgi:chromosomal replication initiation ATPase DnaA